MGGASNEGEPVRDVGNMIGWCAVIANNVRSIYGAGSQCGEMNKEEMAALFVRRSPSGPVPME